MMTEELTIGFETPGFSQWRYRRTALFQQTKRRRNTDIHPRHSCAILSPFSATSQLIGLAGKFGRQPASKWARNEMQNCTDKHTYTDILDPTPPAGVHAIPQSWVRT
jgi:hypothetical protein